MTPNTLDKPSTIKLIAAFFAVYVIWGSTYLAVRFANETLPPLLMASSRFIVAGSVLYSYSRWQGAKAPEWIHWRSAIIIGALLLLIGNGGVAWSLQYVPSSLAAILVATEPLWIVLLAWLWISKKRPSVKELIGLICGFAGIVLLVNFRHSDTEQTGNMLGAVVIIVSAVSWAIGSLYTTKAPLAQSPMLAIAMQMLAGGVLLFITGSFIGEWNQLQVEQISLKSLVSLGYLTIFGSLVGFTAYSWLLRVVSPSLASTYAYVNPVVAVLLGWTLGGESISMQMLLASAVIVGSVILITSQVKSEQPVQIIPAEKEIQPYTKINIKLRT